MKITKQKLKRIIKEEISNVLEAYAAITKDGGDQYSEEGLKRGIMSLNYVMTKANRGGDGCGLLQQVYNQACFQEGAAPGNFHVFTDAQGVLSRFGEPIAHVDQLLGRWGKSRMPDQVAEGWLRGLKKALTQGQEAYRLAALQKKATRWPINIYDPLANSEDKAMWEKLSQTREERAPVHSGRRHIESQEMHDQYTIIRRILLREVYGPIKEVYTQFIEYVVNKGYISKKDAGGWS
tara:strand:+ start:3511 stop:4218 length:708 start_codon:yes stop_codon:yes gene_type:complete